MKFRRLEGDSKFESFFLKSDSCHFLQSLEWAKVMNEEGWEDLPYIVEDGSEIKASILILKKRIPFLGGCILYAPRGPVVDLKDLSVIDFLLSQLKNLGRTERAIFMRIDPDVSEDNQLINSIFLTNGFSKLQQSWSFWNAPKYVLRLRIDDSEDEIFSRMSRSQRNQIRSAKKRGISVISETKSEDMLDFFDLLVNTSRVKGIPHRDFNYYKRLYDVFIQEDKGRLFFAGYKGERIATGMTLRIGKKSWLMYMASNETARKLNANRLLQWEMILWAKREGCDLYDLRGIAVDYPPNPGNANYGVYAFKKDFEPELVELAGYYDLVLRKAYYAWLRFIETKFLPLFMKAYVLFK